MLSGIKTHKNKLVHSVKQMVAVGAVETVVVVAVTAVKKKLSTL